MLLQVWLHYNVMPCVVSITNDHEYDDTEKIDFFCNVTRQKIASFACRN